MQEPEPDRPLFSSPADGGPFILAAVLGALAVAFGAFGAHGVQGFLTDAVDGAKRLEWWRTASHYHLVHALLALGFAVAARGRAARIGIGLVVGGVVLFSGSLYVMTLTNLKVLGAVTPIGGLCFIAAWLWLIPATRRR